MRKGTLIRMLCALIASVPLVCLPTLVLAQHGGHGGEEDFTEAAEADFMEGAAFTAAEAIPTAVITVGAMGGTEVTAAGMAAIGAILVTVTVTVRGFSIGFGWSSYWPGYPYAYGYGPWWATPYYDPYAFGPYGYPYLIRTMGTAMFPAPTLTATPRRTLLHLVT